MREAAVKGLRLRKEFGRGGLSTKQAGEAGIGSGVARAVAIRDHDHLPMSTWEQIHRFFSRTWDTYRSAKGSDARGRYGDDSNPSAGYIAHLLWGGEAAKTKAARVVAARENPTMARNEGNQYAAVPYGYDASPFYFTNVDDLLDKLSLTGIEEYEVEFISGDALDAKVFNAVAQRFSTHSALDVIEGEEDFDNYVLFSDAQKALLADTVGSYNDLTRAFEAALDVSMQEGDAEDALYERVMDLGGPCEALTSEEILMYLDWEAYARDKEINGEISVVDLNGRTYVVFN